MFACLYLPRPVNSLQAREAPLVQIARDFSPRIETHGDRTVTIDISGLRRLIGEPRSIGEELRRAAADAGLGVHIAIAATSTAAILLAHARAGLTVVARGDEASALAPLPLRVLAQLGFKVEAADARPGPKPGAGSPEPELDQLHRWGLRTLGDLAALPSGALSARLGQTGLRWQRWARGEEMRPLVPAGVAESFEESLDLEWPIDGLEPLSFVLARLFEPLCDRLERGDRGAVVLRVTLTLVSASHRSPGEGGRELYERVVELPAPMRDARVLRTLALLDLEANPPPASIDRVAVAVDVTEGRVLQFGLFARGLPTDTLATLLARLGALMGGDHVGAPSLVDTYRPGAFAMAAFDPNARLCADDSAGQTPAPPNVLRRFRSPVPARVVVEQGRPVRVTTDRRGCAGGRVERSEGPWRSSGDWWLPSTMPHAPRPWNCDEWDVALSDGATYRIAHAHDEGTWYVSGLLD
jgi:protein ImuB